MHSHEAPSTAPATIPPHAVLRKSYCPRYTPVASCTL
jgi:hypothetical protein